MIKNYLSESTHTSEKIQEILSKHKAKHIYFEYNDNGRIKQIAFSLEVEGKIISFILPARVEKVAFVMYRKQYEYLNEKHQSQAYRTAWANIRDWLDAQMALIQTQQVKIEEVFLPYMAVGKEKTLFQQMEERQFLLPSST